MSDATPAIMVGTGKLTARQVYHAFGHTEALAFRLETPEGIFVYSGDTGDCAGIREIAAGADIFVCESSARVGDEISPGDYGHLNPRRVGEICQAAGVKKVVLTHYFGFDSDEAMVADCRQAFTSGEIMVAHDFVQLSVG